MSFEEALQVLGVDASADESTVRRAYLRLVKEHKPERDPEGFRRVREAYDLLRSRRAFIGELALGPTVMPLERAPAPMDRPLKADPAAPMDRAAEVAPLEPAPAAPIDRPAETIPERAVDRWYRELDQIPFDRPRERIRFARRVLEETTGEDRAAAYRLLLEELDDAGKDAKALEALRAGAEEGWSDLRDELIARAPLEATDAEVQRAHERGDMHLLLALALANAPLDPAGARDQALAALEHAHEGRQTPWIHAELIEVVLELHAAGAAEDARTVMDRLNESLADARPDERLVPQRAARLVLARELAELPVGEGARRIVARGLRDGHPEEVASAVWASVPAGFLARRRALGELRRAAPAIYQAILQHPPEEPPSGSSSAGWYGPIFAIPLLLGVSCLAGIVQRQCNHRVDTSRLEVALRREPVDHAIEALCPELGDAACRRARMVITYARWNCDFARNELSALTESVDAREARLGTTQPWLRANLGTLREHVDRSCAADGGMQ